MESKWNPNQYNKFKSQRAKPFYDLIGLVDKSNKIQSVIDLGCGTGELSRVLYDELKPGTMLGIDSSREMLEESEKFQKQGIRFELSDISEYKPSSPIDLVFSNAALQWLPDHEALIPKVLSWVSAGGQVAIQMPYNFDHPSHVIAKEVAEKLFPDKFKTGGRKNVMLPQERYAEILFANGFHDQVCRLEIYGHPMASGRDVIEWTKGTTLTKYQAELTESEFKRYLEAYNSELLNVIGEGPCFYAFKRLLIWGRKSGRDILPLL